MKKYTVTMERRATIEEWTRANSEQEAIDLLSSLQVAALAHERNVEVWVLKVEEAE